MDWVQVVRHPAVRGAMIGVATAVWADLRVWKAYQDDEAFARFSWRVAFARWAEGAFSGAMMALGLAEVA